MGTILKEGRNCWRIVQADALSILIDGQAYFEAFQEAVTRARHRLLICGWDIDSRMHLNGGADPATGVPLGPFLDAAIRRTPSLRAHILSWDFSLIFALEREPFPAFKLGWRTHRRLHFYLDGHHPPAGSHHQKIVVIDDQVAFLGGLDLTIHRWDTRAHLPHDPRRIGPAGRPYAPFHDVQACVSGPAAQALGALVQDRWRRATGREIPPAPPVAAPPWPPSARPLLTHVPIALSRTEGAYEGRPGIAEIRALYIDALAQAQRFVYIENQYLTSVAAGDALCALLARPDPPEIVIVLPHTVPGWLQRHTMGVLRARLLKKLRAADHQHRLYVGYPAIAGLGSDCVKIHSKVLIVDDIFVTLGSANINNRSMGLDSECNLSIESAGEPRIAAAIDHLRHDLLGEHLGLSPAQLRRRVAQEGSWLTVIAKARGQERHLEALTEAPEETLSPVADTVIADPERPISARELVESYVPETARAHAAGRLLRNALLIAGLASLGALWHFTPLHVWLNVPRLVGLLHRASHYALTPLIVTAAYLCGGLLFFPVTLLIVVTALTFAPPQSLVYAFLGCLLSASLNYMVGRVIGHQTLDRFGQNHWHELRHRLRRQGLSAMIAVSLVPIAPFTLVTASAGALKIRYRDLVIGTAIGVAPGIVAVTLFTHSLAAALSHPAIKQIAILALIAAALAALALGMRRFLRTHGAKDGSVT